MRNFIASMVVLLLAAAPSSMGQGAIYFNNRSIGNVVAPIYGVNPAAPYVQLRGNSPTNQSTQPVGDTRMTDYTGVPLLSGTGFTAELWTESAPGANDFAPMAGVAAKVTFRTPSIVSGWVPGNGCAMLQVGRSARSAETPNARLNAFIKSLM